MLALAALVLVAVVVASCTSMPDGEVVPPGDPVILGTGPEAESRLLAAVASDLLLRAGYAPTVVELADAGAAQRALDVGDVDLLPGYTGEAWLDLGLENPSSDPRTSFARVQSVAASFGITWLRPGFELELGVNGPPADATFGLFVRGIPSPDADLRTISQLATRLPERPEARVCVDADFIRRDDGWRAVAQAYSIAEPIIVEAGPIDALRGVATGECFVGLGSATDGEAWAAGLQLLDDPLGVFPAFAVTFQARTELVEEDPGIEQALAPLTAHLTTRLLGIWNAQVARGGAIAEVAAAAADAVLQQSGVDPLAVPTG